jgi:tetraacyldisaccharide 4'-kinase
LGQVKRADAVILTKADLSANMEKLKGKLSRLTAGSPIFATRYAPDGLWDKTLEASLPLGDLQGKKILAFTGIGNPASFRGSLESLGARILGFRSFRDHYWFQPGDFSGLLREGELKGAEALVTTEKDAVRLEGFPREKIHLWVLSVRHEFVGREQEPFEEFLWKKLGLGEKG